MSIESWIGSIAIALALFCIGVFRGVGAGDWLFPGRFFALYWGIYLTTSLCLAPEFTVEPSAGALIFLYVLAVYLGSVHGYHMLKPAKVGSKMSMRIGMVESKRWLLLAFIIPLVATPLLLSSRGFSLSALLSFELLRAVSRDFSVARYEEFVDVPLPFRVLTTLNCVGALFGGVWFVVNRNKKERWYAFLPLLPALLHSVIQTTRTTVVVPIVSFCAAFLAAHVMTSSSLKFWSLKKIGSVLAFVIVVFSGYVGIQIMRDNLEEDEIVIAATKAKVAFLGSPAVFSAWFTDTRKIYSDGPAFGAYSFAGLFDLLKIRQREQGIYQDPIFLQGASLDANSNVYTVFRGLVDDFTLLGSIVFVGAFGSIAGISYRCLRNGDARFLPLLAVFYASTLWSPIASLFNYNTTLLAWALFATYFLFLKPKVSMPRDEGIKAGGIAD